MPITRSGTLWALPPGACSGAPHPDPSTCPVWASFTSILVTAFVGKVVSGPGLEGLGHRHLSLGTRLLQGRLGLLDSEDEGREESSSS